MRLTVDMQLNNAADPDAMQAARSTKSTLPAMTHFDMRSFFLGIGVTIVR